MVFTGLRVWAAFLLWFWGLLLFCSFSLSAMNFSSHLGPLSLRLHLCIYYFLHPKNDRILLPFISSYFCSGILSPIVLPKWNFQFSSIILPCLFSWQLLLAFGPIYFMFFFPCCVSPLTETQGPWERSLGCIPHLNIHSAGPERADSRCSMLVWCLSYYWMMLLIQLCAEHF